MKLKPLLIVVALLAVLSGLAWWLNCTGCSSTLADPRVSRPILDAATAEKSARVRITENGKTVELVRAGDAGWQVASYHDLPADFAKLSTLVRSLVTTRVERLVTTSAERIARLGFGDTSITVLDADGKPLLELALGKNADGGGRFLRWGNASQAYLARLDTWLDTESRNWADTALGHFNTADVAKVGVTFPDAATPLTVTRADSKAPFALAVTPEGKRLKADAIPSLLETLVNLRFTETSAPDDPQAVAARVAARTVTLTTFDGKTLTYALGRQPERTEVKADALKPDPQLPVALAADAIKPTPVATAEKTGPAAIAAGPLTEKIPAGPVFAFITQSDAGSAVNASMKKRAFQVGEFALNALPASAEALLEPIPAPPSPPPAAAK